jgi:heptosyltransferase II
MQEWTRIIPTMPEPERSTPSLDPAGAPRPLIVRLRNWVGDVLLGLPTLLRLEAAGYELHLVGRGWARDLLAGHGWPVHVAPKDLRSRIALLRRLRRELRARDAGFDRRLNTVCFPYSFSSALDGRLAGLRSIGHRTEGRGPLLSRAVDRPHGVHEMEVYWHLGSALLGADAPLPQRLGLRIAPAHAQAAEALLAEHGVRPGPVLLCPFSGGTWSGQDKNWPGFAAWAAADAQSLGRSLVLCPGPGEEAAAEPFATAGAVVFKGVGLGTYAALLQRAAAMVSNDTGPGHMAAAVGTPLVSVLGPSDPALWRPWGEPVALLGGRGSWPTAAEVQQALGALLDRTPPAG